MANYKVTWTIDIFDATNPEDAARQAFLYMQTINTTANVFDVYDPASDQTVTVDLGETE